MYDPEVVERLTGLFPDFQIQYIEPSYALGRVVNTPEGRFVLDKILSLNDRTGFVRYGVSRTLGKVIWTYGE